ncbi:hypothetical conserved protein [Candidatus Nitrosoglobus terrae]|uniref:Hypothetical conserved protein n=1 Tax=Candidatus Nitrosoglobus terrae TaxID=1630141 RepID=A0A1Q2SPP6_9GAMM|nr:hypothetical conserved protein [Candidatus Nitrosoglobus terrae]
MVRRVKETPPRAWGRLAYFHFTKKLRRNTPTGVGKTCTHETLHLQRRKHPHGRGEDGAGSLTRHPFVETPPRAWGRLSDVTRDEVRERNTPTGVGKTEVMQ